MDNLNIMHGLLLFAIGLITYLLYNFVTGHLKKKMNRVKIEKKRRETNCRMQEIKSKLEIEGILVTQERKEIMDLKLLDLVEKLRSGILKPITVLQAYQAKALEVNKDINAVCHFIVEAEDWAVELETVEESLRGPLFGVPISVKECYLVKGYDATIGMANFIGKPSLKDCDMVKALKDLHGLPFCLTNVPQTMISYACSNPVYGKTCNPHDLSRSPGGSSGGEAALLAAGGSILGIGSDIGGSLRIPAHFCGVCGMKPTNGRIYEGGRRGGCGAGNDTLKNGVYATAGFMSPHVDGIVLGMKSLLGMSERMAREDWRVVPLPWREDLFRSSRKLKVGWYDQDGMFPSTPGCSRAVRDVADLLHKAGHDVEKFVPPGLVEIAETFVQFILADKGYHSLKVWDGEILDQAIEVNSIVFKTPELLKKLISPLLKLISPKTEFGVNAGPKYSRDLWVKNADKDRLTYAFMKAWEEKEFDVLLCPGFSFPACPPQYCSRNIPAASYTIAFNILGCPAGTLPVTRETAKDQAQLKNYQTKGDLCYKLAKSATEGAEGLPIGIQIIGRHWQEELVLNAMAQVEELINKQKIKN